MKVLLTGASGYIGSAVAAELLAGGHSVTGISRNPAPVKKLIDQGLKFVAGDLKDAALLTREARQHDAIIHAGSSNEADRGEVDRSSTHALLAGAREGAKAFILTSGVWVFNNTGDAWVDESSPTANPFYMSAYRPALEAEVLGAGTATLRTNVIRPGIVYGEHRGILAMWLSSATRDKKIRVVGDGRNRSPFVHRDDLARLYRLVLEKGAPKGVYHATDDLAPTAIDVARALGKGAQITDVETWPHAQAREVMGPFADALVLDQCVKSPASRKLGWTPKHADILAEAQAVVAEFRESSS